MTIGNRQEATGNRGKAKLVGFALCAVLLALCFPVGAQQPSKIPRIGFLPGDGLDVELMHQALQDIGYTMGKNILIEHRDIGGKREQIPSLVSELVQLKVDVIVVRAQPAIRAAKDATKTIPIVMMTTQDPVAVGFSQPGTAGWKHYRRDHAPTRAQWKETGIAEGGASANFACRCPYECNLGGGLQDVRGARTPAKNTASINRCKRCESRS